MRGHGGASLLYYDEPYGQRARDAVLNARGDAHAFLSHVSNGVSS